MSRRQSLHILKAGVHPHSCFFGKEGDLVPRECLVAAGLLLPLLGTALGATSALLLRENDPIRERLSLGFAAGVMLAASVWSLLLPAIDFAEAAGMPPWLSACGGFLAGTGGLLWLRQRFLQCRKQETRAERRAFLLACSVTLHNIPEGLAVGVAFASALQSGAPLAGAMALSFGIAVQNIPEGGIIALPLVMGSENRGKACRVGVLSGVVEPVASALALLLTSVVRPLLPWVLAFAAGCMFFVVTEELLRAPEEEEGVAGTVGAALGFALMMLLDVALG